MASHPVVPLVSARHMRWLVSRPFGRCRILGMVGSRSYLEPNAHSDRISRARGDRPDHTGRRGPTVRPLPPCSPPFRLVV